MTIYWWWERKLTFFNTEGQGFLRILNKNLLKESFTYITPKIANLPAPPSPLLLPSLLHQFTTPTQRSLIRDYKRSFEVFRVRVFSGNGSSQRLFEGCRQKYHQESGLDLTIIVDLRYVRYIYLISTHACLLKKW